MKLWVGIDWGHTELVVSGVNQDGEEVFLWEVPRDGEGVSGLPGRLLSEVDGDPGALAVAIELPRAAVVEALVDQGIAVFVINPKQADRFRDRHTIAGAKDDSKDAFVLGDSLRTDRKLFRRLSPEPEEQIELRELSRTYELLTTQVLMLANQLRDVLRRYHLELDSLGRWHEEPWLWDLFERCPTPAKLQKLQPAQLKKILKAHRIRRYKALPLTERLRQSKPLPVAKGVPEAYSQRALLILPLLRAAHTQRAKCRTQLERVVERVSAPPKSEEEPAAPSDLTVLLSMPGLGILTATTLYAEAHRALTARDYSQLRRLCGSAPVTRGSGKRAGRKKLQVSMRRAAHPRLRNAIFHWARVASNVEPRAKAHYARLRAAGHAAPRALRGVADRLLKMLVAALRSGSLYDPEKRGIPAALPA